MRKDEAKFICDKCGIRGISLGAPYPPPTCHYCGDGTVLRQVEEPEYSHGIKPKKETRE